MKLTELKFISEKREREFNKLNIYTAEELLRLFPRDYLDLTEVTPLKRAYNNDVILTPCTVLNVEFNRYARRQPVKALCQQGNFLFTAIWFNQPYVVNRLKAGDYLFYGRVKNDYDLGYRMINPAFDAVGGKNRLQGIIPVYPLSGTLTQGVVRTAIRQALQKTVYPSYIPPQLQKKYNLSPLAKAYSLVHAPESKEDIKRGSNRIALEEYFLLIAAFKVIKGDRDDARLTAYSVSEREVAEFTERFPFEFTNGQKSAVNDIYKNLRSPHKMNRLLQGDVGSGKTAVALAAIYMAVKSGYQAAMIAPTEVLARQNAALIERYFPEYATCSLTGSDTPKEKRLKKSKIESGDIRIVCGTHAVLQGDVKFDCLSLVICDEQHRFGVAQRASLSEKGESCDVLVMSATPIPRTLSLIFYGDLDVTTITDKPRSRQDISTAIIPESKYNDMLRYVERQASQGLQTYFVCPKIDGDDEGTVMSVTELYESLKNNLKGVRVALLHGKMKDKEKNAVMDAFKNKEYDCLVSTTVIEVGVDVPDATTMIIYNAERFGLSQLHQLRGRVGRGDKKSWCFLLLGSDSEEALERLNVLKGSTDGFKIAEADLKIRGGGDFMGTRQSGKMLSEIKNLKFPVEVIFTAKALVDEAFSGSFDVDLLSRIAAKKYDSLKDVILN